MKKNIDDIFREKFKQAEITPPEEIWTELSAQLPFKKKKRSIIPIWYLVGGTAAILAIMLLLFQDSNSPISNQKITNTPEHSSEENIQNTNSKILNTPKLESTPLLEPKNGLVQTENDSSESQNSSAANRNNKSETANSKFPKSTPIQKPRNAVVQSENEKQKSLNSEENPLKSSETGSDALLQKIETKNFEYASKAEKENSNLNSKTPENPQFSQELIKNDLSIAANDSIKKPEELLANLEDLEILAKDEKVEIVEKSGLSKRLSITTRAGALYFDNLSGGSGIDEQFANNNSSSEISASYGINFGYQISEKLKIRTGINQINLVNNTQDVAYASLVNSRAVEAPIFGTMAYEENSAPVFGKINQNIGFIEVPSEIEYLLVDKKFGINLIGGFSTLFLNKNEISLNTANSRTDLGKVNNLAEISFTANAGVGLNYKISPQFNFNIEPVLKYQLNTFKNIDNFKPYYFGLYSGFSFKF